MPRITLGTVLMFVAIGTTIITALLGAPDWLIVVVAALLFVLALVLPIAIRDFGANRHVQGRAAERPAGAPSRPPHRRHAGSSDSSSGWFGFDGGWSGDGGSDSSGGSSGGGD